MLFLLPVRWLRWAPGDTGGRHTHSLTHKVYSQAVISRDAAPSWRELVGGGDQDRACRGVEGSR